MNNKHIDLTQFDEAIEEARKNKDWKKLLIIASEIQTIASEIGAYAGRLNQEGMRTWEEVTPENKKRHSKRNRE